MWLLGLGTGSEKHLPCRCAEVSGGGSGGLPWKRRLWNDLKWFGGEVDEAEATVKRTLLVVLSTGVDLLYL